MSHDERENPQDVHSQDDHSQAPSKTQRKAEALALRDLGQALAGLTESERAALDLPETLRDAIARYNATRAHGAKKRELQHLGKQMRRVDPAPIRAAVEAKAASGMVDAAAFHRLERWRERLIEDDGAVTEWIEENPGCDVQRLRSLIRAARKEGGVGEPELRHGKSYRALFRFLREQLG